jgi:hypothetical protein
MAWCLIKQRDNFNFEFALVFQMGKDIKFISLTSCYSGMLNIMNNSYDLTLVFNYGSLNVPVKETYIIVRKRLLCI